MYYNEEEEKVNGSSMADINTEIEHFNWAAFFLGWVWAIFNGAFKDILPILVIQILFAVIGQFFLGIIFSILFFLLQIYVGKKGNEWAYYGTKKWKNLEHFRKVQRNWVLWAIIGGIILNILSTVVVNSSRTALGLNKKSSATQELLYKNAKSSFQNANPTSSAGFPTLTGLDGIRYSFSTLKPNTLEYLKVKSELKNYFNGKKLVIYFTGANCPYAQTFENSLASVKGDSSISSEFDFYAMEASGMKTFSSREDALADVDFNNTCHEFCIINTKNGEIFSIDGVGETEASKAGSIITQLKDW